jgi:hypothetical protein
MHGHMNLKKKKRKEISTDRVCNIALKHRGSDQLQTFVTGIRNVHNTQSVK